VPAIARLRVGEGELVAAVAIKVAPRLLDAGPPSICASPPISALRHPGRDRRGPLAGEGSLAVHGEHSQQQASAGAKCGPGAV